MRGDALLHPLEGAVRQIFLTHVTCEYATQGLLPESRGIQFVEEFRAQWIGRAHTLASFSLLFHASQRIRYSSG